MQVVALYRHPFKSFPAEHCDSLEVTADGRVVGDRVLGFRFDDAGPPNDVEWRRKTWFASLQHSPDLALLRCGYDPSSRRIWIRLPDTSEIIEGSIDEPGDRLRIEHRFNDWYAGIDGTPSALGRRKLPLRLVGDGTNGRFHDTSAGLTTLHSRESLDRPRQSCGAERNLRTPLPLQHRHSRLSRHGKNSPGPAATSKSAGSNSESEKPSPAA